jgi:hypothetical protein
VDRIRVALAILATSVAVAGCGGSENAADEKTAAGAKATLVEFADAYAEADGERLCAMVSAELLKAAEKAPGGCEGGVAKTKDILEPKDVVEIKESAAKQTPTVEGDVASLPGRGEVMRYREGRWEITGEGIANP